MRRRGAGQKWKRPSTTLGSRPPGLIGREIGLYYRNKQMKKEPKSIRLEVPDTVISSLHANIRSIEDIARKENIYLTPVKRLKFNKPKVVSDVLPLKAEGTVNNLVPHDDDVIVLSPDKVNDVKNDSVVLPFKAEGTGNNLVPNDDDVIVLSPDKVNDVKNDSVVLPFKAEGTVNNLVPNDDDVIVLSPDKVNDVKNDSDVLPLKAEGTVNSLVPNDGDVIVLSSDEVSDVKNDPVNPKKKPVSAKNEETNEVLVLTDDESSDAISLDLPSEIYDDGDIEIKDAPMNISDSTAKDEKAIKIEIENYGNPHNVNLLDAGESTKAFVPDTKAANEPAVASGSSTNEVIIHDDNEADITRDNINEAKQLEYTVSNIYIPSTSTVNQQSITGENNYKYGYDDIITGTFEEKLNESISKGVSINIRNDTTNELNNALLNEYNIMVNERKYKQMKKFRETLPTFKKTKDLLDIVNENQVVVISGETGCGKSTQVPQIILDDAIKKNRGANVKILVTQPRRIAASSLAMRVADERAEAMGKSVGYAVRLERVECRPRASIMFCTTGVLLVELEVDQCLSKYSHIILDEVHERDCQVDISMCVLKQVLKKRKNLKLILMSATIDAETLCAYYDDCPMLHIEGLAYPVQDIYLEKILQMTRYELPEVKVPFNHGKPWMKHARSKKSAAARDMEKDIQYKAEIGPWLESIKRTIDEKTYKTLQDHRIELLDIDLIMQLLLVICSDAPGAILVFLPGISEINHLMNKMRDSRLFPEHLYEIHPLHSKLPTITQHQIFIRPCGNIRKIIIATNIAETSITIDDVVYVIDCAKVKYSGLNVEDHVSTLQVEWASQANLRQRRGRAGRCQPGICYHLATSYRASKLPERLLPELQRNDLLEPVLQIKRLRLGLADQALKMMPAVPDEKTIMNAVRHLQQCGALDGKETLTPLGWHLARLPVHPAAGKLLLLGSLFGCLERAASVAAVWGFKDPFLLVPGKQNEAEQAKRSLALGEPSDHIAISEALMQWERCSSYSQKSLFANDYFLSSNTLKLLSEMKKQFGQNLKQMGFLRSGDVRSMWENRNSNNFALFKAIVAASLYPNIATVKWGNLCTRNPNKMPYIKVKTPEDPRVQVHPSSMMYTWHTSKKLGRKLPLCSEPGANWLVYWLKQRSTELYLIDVTLVYTLPLLFFGELNVTQAENPDECQIDIKSIKVLCAKGTTQLLFRMRSLLDQVLASKIMVSGGGKRSNIFEEHVLNAVIRLITAEDARTEYFDDDQSGSDDYDRDETTWY